MSPTRILTQMDRSIVSLSPTPKRSSPLQSSPRTISRSMLSVASTNVSFGTEATAVATGDDSGTFQITTQNAFSLTDGTNTNTTLGAIATADVTDGAGPILISTVPTDDGTLVPATAAFTMTFSEDMEDLPTTVTDIVDRKSVV